MYGRKNGPLFPDSNIESGLPTWSPGLESRSGIPTRTPGLESGPEVHVRCSRFQIIILGQGEERPHQSSQNKDQNETPGIFYNYMKPVCDIIYVTYQNVKKTHLKSPKSNQYLQVQYMNIPTSHHNHHLWNEIQPPKIYWVGQI